MIFIIPLILGAAALATAAFGAAKGIEGVSDMQEAEKIGKNAQNKYERAVNEMKVEWESTQKLAEEYGQLQIDVKLRTVGRFVDFIKRIGRRASQSDMASGNNEQLASVLHSITEIAKSSPFKELANLASVQAALDNPDHEWTF